jgi:hypothetical protein
LDQKPEALGEAVVEVFEGQKSRQGDRSDGGVADRGGRGIEEIAEAVVFGAGPFVEVGVAVLGSEADAGDAVPQVDAAAPGGVEGILDESPDGEEGHDHEDREDRAGGGWFFGGRHTCSKTQRGRGGKGWTKVLRGSRL